MAELQYKCPCCGGALEFNSSVQKVKCPYCDTEFEMEALQSYDASLDEEHKEDFTWQTTPGSEWGDGEADGMRVYVCKSCGGEIVGDENMAATACPYCDNPIVMMNQFSGILKPDCVIPFKLDKETAKKKLAEHFKGKKLLPKAFTKDNHIDEIKGIYVPYWLFDTGVDASMYYKATKVKTWEDSKYRYKKTDTYRCVREGDIAYENVPVDGSTKMPDDLMESLEPYNMKDAVDFQTAYLAGYLADKYDVDSDTSINRANERIKKATEDTFRNTVKGFNTVTPSGESLRFHDGHARYALYPVWLLNTTWNGEKYVFAMNGQTGKFVGNLPCDKGLFWKSMLITTAITSTLAFFGMCLFNCIGGIF